MITTNKHDGENSTFFRQVWAVLVMADVNMATCAMQGLKSFF